MFGGARYFVVSKSSLGVTLCVEVFLRVLHPPQNDQPEAVPLPQPTDTVFGEETQEGRFIERKESLIELWKVGGDGCCVDE